MIATNHLKVFEAVAHEKSLAGAAHLLNLTQPTVSHHINALEEELGTTLFVRGRRGVELTDRGHVLLDHAELILSQILAAERALEDLVNMREGTLRLTTFATAGATFLPAVLAKFRADFHGVSLYVTECEVASTAVEDVRARRQDIAIVYTTPGHWVRPVPGLAAAKLFGDPLSVVLPPGHRLAHGGPVRIAELSGENWISAKAEQDPCRILLERAAHDAGFEPQVTMQVDDYAMVGGCVLSGIGVALAPRMAFPRLPKGVVVAELEGPPLEREISALVLGDGSHLPAAKLMTYLRNLDRKELGSLAPPGDPHPESVR